MLVASPVELQANFVSKQVIPPYHIVDSTEVVIAWGSAALTTTTTLAAAWCKARTAWSKARTARSSAATATTLFLLVIIVFLWSFLSSFGLFLWLKFFGEAFLLHILVIASWSAATITSRSLLVDLALFVWHY